jgi:hypothetical protein
MAAQPVRIRICLLISVSLVIMVFNSILPIQIMSNAHAQVVSTPIRTGDVWKGTESDLSGGNVVPVKLQITSILSGQQDPIRGTWEWNNTPDPSPTIFGGSEEIYAHAYPGSLTDVIKIWGKSPIDRYIAFTMTGTILGYIVEEANGDFKGIHISIMGQVSWIKFILHKVVPPARNKLIVIVQGISSYLNNTKSNGDYGGVPEFAWLENSLRKRDEFKNAQFMVFSYLGSDSKTGKPLPYDCSFTYAIHIQVEKALLSIQILNYVKAHPNTDVYIIAHSLGGVITFAYISDLVEKYHSLSPGYRSVVKGIIIGDSPLGGIITDLRYATIILYESFHCNVKTLLDGSVEDLENLYRQTQGNKSFQGMSASIYHSILNEGKGTYISNQAVAQHAINLGLRLLIVGNDYDLLWHPDVCGIGSNFIHTQYLVERGQGYNGGVLLARSFKSGSLSRLNECPWLVLGTSTGHHFDLLTDKDVATAIWEVFSDRNVDVLTPVTIKHKA